MQERLRSGGASIVESHSVSLVEVLDRVLDKGLVVAGDIRVSLANVELLTIQIRLLVCSVDKAEQIGMTWWRDDGFLSNGVSERLERIEKRLDRLAPAPRSATSGSANPRTSPRKRST